MIVDWGTGDKLRELAGWYRDFAEKAGNPAIWEGRIRTAEDLEEEADRLAPLSSPQDARGIFE
jgi:hypothetical protein